MFWRTEKKTHTNTTTFCNNKKITYISKRIAYLNILSVHLIQIYFLFLRLLFISLFFYLALTSPWRACDVTYSPNPPARDVDGDVTADQTFCSCCNRCCYRVWFACFLFFFVSRCEAVFLVGNYPYNTISIPRFHCHVFKIGSYRKLILS